MNFTLKNYFTCVVRGWRHSDTFHCLESVSYYLYRHDYRRKLRNTFLSKNVVIIVMVLKYPSIHFDLYILLKHSLKGRSSKLFIACLSSRCVRHRTKVDCFGPLEHENLSTHKDLLTWFSGLNVHQMVTCFRFARLLSAVERN